MSSFIRLAICGSLLKFSTGLILLKKIDLTPNSEFQMCLWKCVSPTLRHATTFCARRYNIHGLGRIVFSHARSCVEDVTTRWLGFPLRPAAL